MNPARRLRSARGAALVEFAFVLPLLLVVIGGVVDFGFLFQRYEVVTNAAREGARLGTLPGYGCDQADTIKARVRAYVQTGLSLTNPQLDGVMPLSAIVVDCTPLSVTVNGAPVPIPSIQVTATYTHRFIMLGPVLGLIGGNWGSTMNLVGRSQMRLEVAG